MATSPLASPARVPGFTHATRIISGLTARAEGRTLAWLVTRIPSGIHSDHLTLLALGAMTAGGVAYAVAGSRPWALWLANLALAVNWYGDSLDGTLARHRRVERPRYGFYVDHVVDVVGIAALVSGMAAGGFLSPVVAASFLAAYFLLSIEVYLAAYCVGTFRLSFFGCGPTELRLLLALGNAATFAFHPSPHLVILGRSVGLYDPGALAAAAGLLVVFAVSAVRNTRILHAREVRG
ncbi:MAG: CDP-alcohol phosphatidyltransferase family protein [Vicinamibacterales bacterium]